MYENYLMIYRHFNINYVMNTNDHACNIFIYQYDDKSYDIMSLMLNYDSYLNALTKLLPLFVLVFLTLFSIWNFTRTVSIVFAKMSNVWRTRRRRHARTDLFLFIVIGSIQCSVIPRYDLRNKTTFI